MTRLILQNVHQQHRRPRPTRQLRQGRAYRLQLEDIITDGELDTSMIRWAEHRVQDGAALFLVSARGKQHAREEARRMGIDSLFSW